MDSQITLVNCIEKRLVLVFDRPAPKKILISHYNSNSLVYDVENTYGHTIVRLPDGSPVATVKYNEILSDRITFADGISIPARKWIKCGVFSVFPVSFRQHGIKYTWKQNNSGKFSLHAPHTPNAVAWFQPCQPDASTDPYGLTSAYLVLMPDAIDIQEAVVYPS
ncbi:hypothetical protein BD779DRAFT_1671585 [Infundibulicybe gibba]|nr:hypothetical protein BD779DRAFT_1671585 [Infundibulicybe gibba]